MSIKSDRWIKRMATAPRMIEPFAAVRARVGGLRDARDLEHDAAAGQDLRQRRDRPGPLFHRGRGRRVRVELRRQEGQVPGAAGNHAAEAVTDPYSVMAAAATARMT